MLDIEPYANILIVLICLVCILVYCATNIDNPPDWWPECMQPSWKKDEKEDNEYNQV